MTQFDPEYVEHAQRQIADFERRASTTSGRTPKNTLFQPRNRNGAAPMQNLATDTIDAPRPPQMARTVHVPEKITINGVPAPAAPTSLLDIILTAGADPNFDVEKFARLVQIQRDEQDRQDARADRAAEMEAEAAFNTAMAAVQKKMTAVRATTENTQTRSVYADYAALMSMLRPIYSEAHFALSYGEEDSPKPDHVRVYCMVTHSPPTAKRSFTRKYHTDMPADGKGARGGDVMSRTHATKSAFTYSQGALVRLIFNIAVSKDDDGNAASASKPAAAAPPPGTISADQAAQIRKLLEERKIVTRAFLNFIRLPSIEHIGVEHFDRALAAVKNFGARS
jgi:hypothetical protein